MVDVIIVDKSGDLNSIKLKSCDEREFYKSWQKPFLSVFSGDDPVTNGAEKDVLKMCPNATSAPNIGGGHFFQWTKAKKLSNILIDFIKE